jgi:hypothetical protein
MRDELKQVLLKQGYAVVGEHVGVRADRRGQDVLVSGRAEVTPV